MRMATEYKIVVTGLIGVHWTMHRVHPVTTTTCTRDWCGLKTITSKNNMKIMTRVPSRGEHLFSTNFYW